MTHAIVIFDLDGTLVDSAADLRRAVNVALASWGLRPVSLEEVRGFVGEGARSLVERALVATGGEPADLEAMLDAFLRAYRAAPVVETRAYPGAHALLRRLRADGRRLALCTNKPEVHTRLLLDALGLADAFEVVIGGDTLPERKPHPAPLLEAVRRLGGDAGSAVMVGDSAVDVATARAAGVKVIVVAHGYCAAPAETLGADLVVGGLSEVLAALGSPERGRSASGPPRA